MSMFGIKSCHRMGLIYNWQVRLNWNFLWLAMLTASALFLAGCGGINATGSVSPATFLLPGVMMNTVPAPATGEPTHKVASASFKQFALAR
jgi:hypothetical protein